MLPKTDTIAAVATAPGRGGIGVVRISGRALQPLTLAILGRIPEPRLATYASFLDAQGRVLDQGISIYFPAPHSYTGEDVLELQGHGGPAVLQLVLQRCLELGARPAAPGEFTQRAFLNGKLDLAQAESVADIIEASTGQAARSAMRSLQGAFSAAVRHLVDGLIHLRVQIEAAIDFPEEEIEIQAYHALLKPLAAELDDLLETAKQGSLLREGAHVVLAGRPNVGKSSLINRLGGEDIALVSEIPGTTRDAIRQTIQIGGVPLHLFDTAGLRESPDAVEQMGMARTRNLLRGADVVLVLLDASAGFTAEDRAIVDSLPPGIPRLYIFNKVDLLDQPARVEREGDEKHVYLSARTGAGLALLSDELLALIGWHREEGVFMARERHVRALLSAGESLRRAEAAAGRIEVLAEELRLAQKTLGAITGEFAPDDLLGEIFSRFCIGK